MSTKEKILFSIILGLGLLLRLFDVNWDSGFSMHPDERAITMSTIPITLPSSFTQFFDPQSPLNPHFFAYGSFPIYLLKAISSLLSFINPLLNQYPLINLVGRPLSALFDSATIVLVFLIGRKIYNKHVGIIASFLYTVSVFPIQVAHFYAVDTILTFFIILSLYWLLIFYQKPTFFNSFLIGVFFGLGLATKDSALALLSSIGITLCIDFLLIFLKQPHRITLWLPHIPKTAYNLIKDGFTISLVSFITFFIFEPYAIIDFPNFLSQTLQQSAMTHSAFTFPYTLQYVGITPYWYEIKNIILWGQGIPLSIITLLGMLYVIWKTILRSIQKKKAENIIIIIFLISYTVVVGHFAVGFMRYMLPIYPILSLYGAFLLYDFSHYLYKKHIYLTYSFLTFVVLGLFIWPLSFLHIYLQSNTRVSATDWILNNIPKGSTIATEYWDDVLPLAGQQNYKMESLSLYTPDTREKWQAIYQELQNTNYIIIASNRVYIPLQKLTDCSKLPPGYCFTETAAYYQYLFSGKLGFVKVAEFSDSPELPFTNIRINDQDADESFTVYDHPKVMIFKKIALSNLLNK